MRIITNTRLWLFAAVVATGLYLGGSAPAAGEAGPYSCCGDATCSVLKATGACPQGDNQCSGTASNCCENSCNDPQEQQ